MAIARFMLFTFDSQAPSGGWDDLHDFFYMPSAAIKSGQFLIGSRFQHSDTFHVVDLVGRYVRATGKINDDGEVEVYHTFTEDEMNGINLGTYDLVKVE